MGRGGLLISARVCVLRATRVLALAVIAVVFAAGVASASTVTLTASLNPTVSPTDAGLSVLVGQAITFQPRARPNMAKTPRIRPALAIPLPIHRAIAALMA